MVGRSECACPALSSMDRGLQATAAAIPTAKQPRKSGGLTRRFNSASLDTQKGTDVRIVGLPVVGGLLFFSKLECCRIEPENGIAP